MTSSASSLHSFLKKYDKRPTKSLSQNFLIDENITEKLIKHAEIVQEDIVLEIGPGSGAITRKLLDRGATVFAIEKDQTLSAALAKQLSSPNFNLFSGDILTYPLETILPKNQKVKVVSNLPFQITSPLLGKLLPLFHQISSLTLILQKDIVQRLLAKPQTKAFSSLTLFTRFYADCQPCFDIPSQCYYPKPAIETSAVQFTLKQPPTLQTTVFFQLIRQAFSQRRKMISTSINYPSQYVQETLNQIGLNARARPEDLNLAQWIDLYRALDENFIIKRAPKISAMKAHKVKK